jgi:hypothetical protein
LISGVLLLSGLQRASAGDELAPCSGCELSIGLGGTYHYWGRTDGVVIPVIFSFSDARYELGAFRMSTSQWIEFGGEPPPRRYAYPYWGFSLSRRWRLLRLGAFGLYAGLGASYKTETDQLDSTRWNFAEQLAFRWERPHGPSLELSIRHWSNAGIKLPNRGQDFAVLTLVF